MLNKETFIEGMTILKSCYLNFNFSFIDSNQMNIWYTILKRLDNEEFINSIHTYCRTNRYAPTCPYNIIETYETIEKSKYIDENKAWELFRKINRENGYLANHSKEIYEKLKDYPIIYKIVQQNERELMQFEESNPYIPIKFKEMYKKEVDECIKTDSVLVIDLNGDIKVLDNKRNNLIEVSGGKK